MLRNNIYPCNFIVYGIFIEYPIIMHVDNDVAILLSDNKPVSECTKHIYARHL